MGGEGNRSRGGLGSDGEGAEEGGDVVGIAAFPQGLDGDLCVGLEANEKIETSEIVAVKKGREKKRVRRSEVSFSSVARRVFCSTWNSLDHSVMVSLGPLTSRNLCRSSPLELVSESLEPAAGVHRILFPSSQAHRPLSS